MGVYVRVVFAGVAAVSLGMLTAAGAHAGCTLNEDVGAVRRSINSISRCNRHQLRKVGVPCKLHTAPACAGSLVDGRTLRREVVGLHRPAPRWIELGS